MAGVETIASIVGIASVGIKLAKTLYQVGYKTANANHNINRIATNVSLFASMLKHVGSVLDDAQSLHSPEAVETVKQLVKECESVFKEIADIIVLARDKSEGSKEPPAANGSKRRISMIARARWYFEGPKAEHLLAQLEYLKTTLSVLLQTLNLAALTAKINATLGQSEKPEDVVQQERLHVETLIVAQQLSVCNLKETQEKLEAESTRPSTPSDDNTADSRYPKLLTQSSETSLQMIRLGNDNLDFLDRRHSVTPADGAKLQPSTSRSEAFIEELLSRWTVQAEIEDSGASDDSDDLEEDPERQATPVPGQPKTRHDSTDSAKNKSTTSAPSLHVQPSNPTPSISTAPTIPSTLSKQWMSARSDAATVATRDRMSTRTGSTGYAATDLSSMPSRMTSPRTAMERSMTNPEADGMPTLISFHDHHALQNPQPLGYMSTPGIVPPPPRSESSASTLPAHRRALAPYMAGAAAASGNRLHPGWGNYRQPYVSDEDSTWSPSDSDESRPSSRAGTAVARTRRDSNVSSAAKRSRNAHRDSGFGGEVGDSLGIPWRIQVNPDKYFDFRDDMLVGPRTPYLPSEPRSWIYLQPSASTEIAKKWVCEEALIEMRYPHNEFRETHDAPAIAAQHGGWRILQPLKFVSGFARHILDFDTILTCISVA